MISPPLCRLSILLMPVLLCSCVSAEKSFRDASARNTAAAYEGFIRGYPENPLAKQAKDRLQEKRDYLAFSAVEQKNTAASYAEFASQNPNNRFAEEAARRSIETDEEAFFRTFRIGSGTAYHGFISTYPDSKYQPDAHEYLSWLVQQRIGISFDEHVSYSSYMDKVTEALLKVGILGVSLTSDQREAQTAFPVVVHFSAIRRTAPSRRYFDVGTQVGMQHGAVGVLIGGVIGATADAIADNQVRDDGSVWWTATVNAGGQKEDRGEINYTREKQTFYFDTLLDDPAFLPWFTEGLFISWVTDKGQASDIFLLSAMNHGDNYLTCKAIASLEFIQESVRPTIRETLTQAFTDDSNEIVACTGNALSRLQDRQVADFMIAALSNERWIVRQNAAIVLGKIKDGRSVEPLLSILQDEDADVRVAAVNALAELRDNRSIPQLIEVLKDNNVNVKAAAAKALHGMTAQDFDTDYSKWHDWLEGVNVLSPAGSGQGREPTL